MIIVASGTMDGAAELRPRVKFHRRRRARWLGEVEGAARREGMV